MTVGQVFNFSVVSSLAYIIIKFYFRVSSLAKIAPETTKNKRQRSKISSFIATF